MILLMTVCLLFQEEAKPPTVGMWGRIEGLVIPGPELAAKPLEDQKRPIVLRVVAVYRHGSAHRYDLAYYGLEPGSYDLRESLVRKDGSPTKGLAPISVTVLPSYPEADRRTVKDLGSDMIPSVGGYAGRMIVLGVLWVIGLLALPELGRLPYRSATSASTCSQGRTFSSVLGPIPGTRSRSSNR